MRLDGSESANTYVKKRACNKALGDRIKAMKDYFKTTIDIFIDRSPMYAKIQVLTTSI